MRTIVHASPIPGASATGCCFRRPFDLPNTDRMTTDADEVTCDILARACGDQEPLRDPTDPMPTPAAWTPPVITEQTWRLLFTASDAERCLAGLAMLRRLYPDEVGIGQTVAKLEQVGP